MINDVYPACERERVATRCVCCGSAQLSRSPAVLMPFVSHRALGWAPAVIDASWGLNSIPQGTAYCVCNTLHCAQCEFLFLDIRFSDREMQRLYDGYYGKAYEDLREHYEPGFRERNKVLSAPSELLGPIRAYILRHIAPTRILDWGGGDGSNTPFKGQGYSTDIYDIDKKPTVAGTASVTKDEVRGRTYDLIVCRHVLEHVPYPADTLALIRASMQDDTLLYVELPHEALMVGNDQVSAEQKRHWHEHINFFSVAALTHLLERGGFTVLDIQSSAFVSNAKLGSAGHLLQAIVKKAPSEGA